MFAAYCPTHGSRILLDIGRLVRLDHTDHGIEAHLRCYCGADLVVHPGRQSSAGPAVDAEAVTVPARSRDLAGCPA